MNYLIFQTFFTRLIIVMFTFLSMGLEFIAHGEYGIVHPATTMLELDILYSIVHMNRLDGVTGLSGRPNQAFKLSHVKWE